MLSLKISELDLVNLLALSWSVSLLISKLGYTVNDSLRKTIINCLPRKLEVEKKGEIPTICFSIASYTSMNTALDLFVSFSSLNSENTIVMDLLIDFITKQTNESDIILDINTFVNIWLGLSKFYLKGGDKSIEGISHMIKFFLSQYEKRKYLSAISMTLDEVCSLLVCFSILDMEPNKLYSDLGSNVKNNIKKFDNIQLIQLISCGRYLFNSKRHSGNLNYFYNIL